MGKFVVFFKFGEYINQNVEYAKSLCPADLTEIEYNLIEQQNPNQHLSFVNPTKIMENPQAIAFCGRYKQIPAKPIIE